MIPEGNPNGRVARKSGRDPKFKEAFTIRFWQPLSLQHAGKVLGDRIHCKFIRAVHQAYACAALASKILQVLHECSLSSVARVMVS